MAEGSNNDDIIIQQTIQPIINLHVIQRGDQTVVYGNQIMNQINASGGDVESIEITESCVATRHQDETQRQTSEERLEPGENRKNRNSLDFQQFFFEEKATSLIKSSKYGEALPLLHQLLHLQNDIWHQIKVKLMITECVIRSQSLLAAMKHIDDIIKIVITSQQSDDVSGRDVIIIAKIYAESELYIRAMILIRCASKLYQAKGLTIADAVSCMRTCLELILNAKVFQATRDVALDLGLPSMYEMLEEIRKMRDVNQDEKTKIESCCLSWIGIIHRELGEHKKSCNVYKESIALMQRQFENNASKCKMFGVLLFSLGTSYEILEGKKTQATECYKSARKAFQEAEDFDDEEDKKRMIRLVDI